MERREILKLVTLATGAVVSTPLASSLLISCLENTDYSDVAYELQFFTKNEFATVSDIATIILPETDTPSATQVGVPHVIDTVVATVYTPEARSEYSDAFRLLLKTLNANPKQPFLEMDSMEQLALLKNLNGPKKLEEERAYAALIDLKQQIIAFYLTREEIAKNHLNYLPVPGAYNPCMDLYDTNGKAWAI